LAVDVTAASWNTQLLAMHKTVKTWDMSAGNVHAGHDREGEQLLTIPKCLCFCRNVHPTVEF